MLIANADAPPLTVKFGALVVDPPSTFPKLTVAVAAMFLVKPPVPVKVKPVADAIDNTVVAAVVLVRAMLFVLKAIARVLVLLELKIPALRVPPSERVPAVKVKVFVTPKVAPLTVTVAPGALTVTLPIVLVTPVVRVPVANNVGLKLAALEPVGPTNIPP